MKKAFLVAFLFFAIVLAHAQIRSYVGIVTAMPNPAIAEFYKDLAQKLADDGYRTYASAVNDYAKARFFGSGFVYVAADGKNYIVTNNHVIGNAQQLSIEFQLSDGKIEKYENLTVLASSSDLDIALLAFPPAKQSPFKTGLTFSAKPVQDGQAVWSAGFPGLAGEPAWQLGNGVITNAVARVKELVDPAYSTLIQHSAQVDPGNSGGPLLIENPASPNKYEVVGINTWSFRRRQAANFALPSATIQQYITDTLKNQESGNKVDEAKKSAEKFIKAMEEKASAYINVAAYISYQYVYEAGYTAFKKMLQTAPQNIRQELIAVFMNVSPLDGLRYAISYNILAEIRPDETAVLKLETATQAGADTVEAIISFAQDKKPVKSVWKIEQGAWRVTAFDNIELDKKKGSSGGISAGKAPKISSPYKHFISVSYDLEFPITARSHGFSLSYMHYFSKFFGSGVQYQMDSVATRSNSFGSNYATSLRSNIDILLGLRLPVDFGSFQLIPYANIGVGPYFVSNTFGANFVVNPGVYMGLGLKGKMNVMLGVSYKWRTAFFTGGNMANPSKNFLSISANLVF